MSDIFFLTHTRNHCKLYYAKVLTTPRLQRKLTRTFACNFTVKYIPCSTDQLTYCLSQLGGQKDKSSYPSYMYTRLQVNYKPEVTAWMKWELPCKKMMNLHSSNIHLPMDGQAPWEVPSEIQAYWIFREELTVEDGIILKGTHIVVPHKKCKTILTVIQRTSWS